MWQDLEKPRRQASGYIVTDYFDWINMMGRPIIKVDAAIPSVREKSKTFISLYILTANVSYFIYFCSEFSMSNLEPK